MKEYRPSIYRRNPADPYEALPLPMINIAPALRTARKGRKRRIDDRPRVLRHINSRLTYHWF